MIKKLPVTYDSSASARAAFDFALDLAGIDHIVVGHRGRGVFERWLLGSVARQVIAYAPCAVTVVRPPRG